MENLPPPNNNQNAPEEEPFMDQAPADIDGFAPHWFGEHFLNINNGWIEWDVPLGGEVDEPMVDPEVNEEVMDDDWDVEVEWLMAPVTPPRATVTVSSTYEVGGPSTAAIEGPSFPLPAPGLPVPRTVIEDLGTRLGNLEYRHGVLTRKVEELSDAEVADHIAIGEIHPRVATVGEPIQVVKTQTVQMVNRLEDIETRVQQVESRLDTYPSGQMTVSGQDMIAGSSEQDKFEMSMMGELNFFLGLQIKQMEYGIFFNYSKYIKVMLKKFGLEDSKPTKTPMSTEIKLTKDD
uniref:Retrovirus-related Pol polyprotein from transposon TNT 1-94 n=1 Tax=Tanacetum cinerariifolium TaxID=118510 RepID=A0A6L2M253_TANCI|nr:retrovirus-related Pol polyprotein from transposon TNT 1-94 [Tanacetum cinerariifolium]